MSPFLETQCSGFYLEDLDQPVPFLCHPLTEPQPTPTPTVISPAPSTVTPRAHDPVACVLFGKFFKEQAWLLWPASASCSGRPQPQEVRGAAPETRRGLLTHQLGGPASLRLPRASFFLPQLCACLLTGILSSQPALFFPPRGSREALSPPPFGVGLEQAQSTAAEWT